MNHKFLDCPLDDKNSKEITGGFSRPSKMPCPAFSISAFRCKTGEKLRAIPGSTCEICYATRNTYLYPNTKNAMERRYQGLSHPRWAEAMAFLIKCEGNAFFRWHDSGDIQSVEHLQKIVKVCTLTPSVSHWLPTREVGILGEYLNKGFRIPENLTIRLSAFMVDAPPPKVLAEKFGCVSSVVTTTPDKVEAKVCPSNKQGNKCLDCRACWDKAEKVVAYVAH
jgi:hypothetical protein